MIRTLSSIRFIFAYGGPSNQLPKAIPKYI